MYESKALSAYYTLVSKRQLNIGKSRQRKESSISITMVYSEFYKRSAPQKMEMVRAQVLNQLGESFWKK